MKLVCTARRCVSWTDLSRMRSWATMRMDFRAERGIAEQPNELRYHSGGTGSTEMVGAGPAPRPPTFDQVMVFRKGWAAGSTERVIVPAAPSFPARPSEPARPSVPLNPGGKPLPPDPPRPAAPPVPPRPPAPPLARIFREPPLGSTI